MSAPLTERWTPLRVIAAQRAYANSPHRFNVVPAGRRSGKTEFAKRKIVLRAFLPQFHPMGSRFPNPHYFCAAPTREQAKRIYWEDLKQLIPKPLVDAVSESELTIYTKMNSSITVLGMDKPERVEGSPWDGGILDEYGNMKGGAWGANIRPALADRQGWCDLIGVPEGRNHYYEMAEKAKAMMAERGDASEFGYFTWFSSEVLPEHEILAAKENLDELTFRQEYEASFVNFTGRTYYAYDDGSKASLDYNPNTPLVACFDFNVEPGVCALAQEGLLPNGLHGTKCIGEVYIPNNSNTILVCNKLVTDYGQRHRSEVHVYGDATGGARGTSRVNGSDWDLVREVLRPVFGDRLKMFVGRQNPPERHRVNAVNTRLCSASGVRHMFVDVAKAPNLSRDLDGVRCVEGGSGEIDKHYDKKLTHISDALGYYIHAKFHGASGMSAIRAIYG